MTNSDNQLGDPKTNFVTVKHGRKPALDAAGFISDPIFGFRLPDGQDFIGEKDFITLDQQIQEIKLSKKKIILSLGDSSTSGWDTDAYLENVQKARKGLAIQPAFFRYKTYNDILRNQLNDKFIVINAGVPAYSSHQGVKRLKSLLYTFKQNGIHVSYVLSYFGNNDSVWWVGGEDKYWIDPKKTSNNLKLDYSHLSHNSIKSQDQVITRTNPSDFQQNLIKIHSLCHSNNIVPIFIEPLTSLYWRPGSLDKHRMLQRLEQITPPANVKELIEDAINIWEVAVKDSKYTEVKKLLLVEAREKDYLLTRIKINHLEILKQVSLNNNIPLVSINLDEKQDDSRYFLDAYHPNEKTNKLIADAVNLVIIKYEKKGTK